MKGEQSVGEVVEVRIQEIRKSKGIKQKELAAKLGIAANTLSQYETGNREPDLETIKRIALILEVTVDELLGAKIKTRPQAGDGLSREALEIARLFDSAAKELKETVSNVLTAGVPKRKAIKIKITCPIDGTEQVIEQPYLEIGGQKFPDENNGCEMCHPGEDCEKCRMNAMLKVFRLDG